VSLTTKTLLRCDGCELRSTTEVDESVFKSIRRATNFLVAEHGESIKLAWNPTGLYSDVSLELTARGRAGRTFTLEITQA